jgi:catechol 2,3-dioxygenase-like lactoylglutathione lyase family enzyme
LPVVTGLEKGITVKRIAFIADPNGIPIELAEI